MTKEGLKRMHGRRRFFRALVSLLGLLEALLLARLVARLLAARTENMVIGTLYMVTKPFTAPLEMLDANQPRFGAALELSTLIVAICVPLLAYGCWRLLGTYEKAGQGQ